MSATMSATMSDAAVQAAPDRLELARGLLTRAERRPVVAAEPDARTLPVAPALARLLPGGGLRRGTTVALPDRSGATSLLFALLARASVEGAWTAVVGRPELGIVAAAEAGLALERLALVPEPGIELLAVTGALLDGLDVVAVAARAPVRAADRQRLAARARQRGAVLLALGPWPGADVELRCTGGRWSGIGAGAGRLRSRSAIVHVGGRGVAARGGGGPLLLPGPEGCVAAPTPVADPIPIRAAG